MKKIKIFIIILEFVLSFPIHFIHDKFPCFLTSIFFPVNESIWEHMKIIYTSIVLASIIEYFIYKRKNISTNNFIISIPISAIFGIIFYLVIYSIIILFVPHNFFIAIGLMFITYIFSNIISYIITNKKEIPNQNKLGISLILIGYIIFTHLTYYPLDTTLFIDPITNKCGL